MTKQLPALTSLRGIAAMGILFHHITIYFLPELAQYISRLTPFCEKNYIWVDFFFILSGFIACHVYKNKFSPTVTRLNFVNYITSRFARLYPLHLAILACFVVLEFIYLYLYHSASLPVPIESLPVPFDSAYSEKALLLNVLFLQALPQWGSWNGPSWAISAIWIIAFTVPFSIQLTRHSNRWTDSLLFFLSLIALAIIYNHSGTLDIMSWNGLVRCFSETLIGILAYKVYERAFAKRFLASPSCCAIVFLCTMLSMALPIDHIVTVITFIPLILTAAYVEPNTLFTHPFLLFLGKISFSLYMIHWFFFQLIDKISLITTGVALHRLCSFPQLIALTSLLLLSIPPLSYFAYKYIEIPFCKRFRLSTFFNK